MHGGSVSSPDERGASVLARLVAAEEIKTLKARFLRAVDGQQWQTVASLITPDCVMDFGSAGGKQGSGTILRSRDEYLGHVGTGRMEGWVTSHVASMPDITFEDDDHASGIWTLFDYVSIPESGQRPLGLLRHHDAYRRQDGQWLVASSRLERIAFYE